MALGSIFSQMACPGWSGLPLPEAAICLGWMRATEALGKTGLQRTDNCTHRRGIFQIDMNAKPDISQERRHVGPNSDDCFLVFDEKVRQHSYAASRPNCSKLDF